MSELALSTVPAGSLKWQKEVAVWKVSHSITRNPLVWCQQTALGTLVLLKGQERTQISVHSKHQNLICANGATVQVMICVVSPFVYLIEKKVRGDASHFLLTPSSNSTEGML